ncbi:hypothetical protein [Acidomonas methanolica]|uniref:hypothetical protein n=1 Tax=Acidomonas methanolica TaxID=437 RepID=UPI00105344C4|nr:hypothetical protein [Acidomonas methanolica]MBU2653829.1 hypothetical protein [Acidomonas methanolica]TCS21416.1 hypothetical protein EDC31_1382 [Acidomonas methanolica]
MKEVDFLKKILGEDEFVFHSAEQVSEDIVVWFGGLGEPFISKKFSETLNINVLSFIDKNSSWYSERKSIISRTLSGFFSYFRFQKKIFCGQSSGGYAALLFGKKVNANLFMLYSPQIKNSFSGDGHMSPPFKINNLERNFSSINGNIILTLPRSENDHKESYRWDDWWQTDKIRKMDNVIVVTLPCDYHAVTVWLKERGIFYDYVNSFIKMRL